MTINQLAEMPLRSCPQIIVPPSEITEAVLFVREHYVEAIKPLILAGDYAGARQELEEAVISILQAHGQEIRQFIHCGSQFIHYTSLLSIALKYPYAGDKEDNLPQRIKEFEAYAAQTKLPLAR